MYPLLPGWFAALLRWLFPAFGRISSRTTAEVLASAGCSKELTGALSYIWGDCGLPPGESSFAMHATLVNHYMGGSFYPVGGPPPAPPSSRGWGDGLKGRQAYMPLEASNLN